MADHYCYIKGEYISNPGLCPKSTKSISNLHLRSDAEKIKQGYYPVEYVKPEYDSKTHRIKGYTKELSDNKVICTYQVEEIPAKTPKQILAETNMEMIPVIEGLINVLVSRGVMTLKDLPQEAQDLIKQREDARKLL